MKNYKMYFETDYKTYIILPSDAETERTGSTMDSHRLFFNKEDIIDSGSKGDAEAIKKNTGVGGEYPEDFDSTTTYNSVELANSPKALITEFGKIV
jgi:hypothetical protein